MNLHQSPGYLPFFPVRQVLCFCSEDRSRLPVRVFALGWYRAWSDVLDQQLLLVATGELLHLLCLQGWSVVCPILFWTWWLEARNIPAFRFMNMSIILEHCYTVLSLCTTTFITSESPLSLLLDIFRIVAIIGLRYTENWTVDSAVGIEDWDRGQEQSRALDIDKL